jgi:hypothetical protein
VIYTTDKHSRYDAFILKNTLAFNPGYSLELAATGVYMGCLSLEPL